MFIPFLASALLAAVFTQLGAMSVRIAMLTSALNAIALLSVVLVALIVWQRRKAQQSTYAPH